jgi:hypothetical protein
MAITLQLARLDKSLFDRVRDEAGMWNELTNFRLIPSNQYLDLNWAAGDIEQLLRLSDRHMVEQAAFQIGTKGLIPLQVDLSLQQVEGVTFGILPNDVFTIANGLAKIDVPIVLQAIPKDEVEWNRLFGSNLDRGARHDFLGDHLNSIKHFYAEAALAKQSVITWYD